ncbi:DUF2267 domain-containing protein [Streptomyces sp. NPDC005385]|uniref:DUF2267 domain-containing protein n=1 Tax=Streptomyces sp. NPDC005385 TaxID=3157039 RepID=UPI0033B17415
MYDQPRSNSYQPSMTFEEMLERVRHEGAYSTRDHAAGAVHQVLTAPGRQLTGDERVDLAQCLPVEAALALTTSVPNSEPLTGRDFVTDLASRTGASPATTRWDTGAVLATVARLTGPGLLARILHQLPEGYALLFGQAELRRPEPAAA